MTDEIKTHAVVTYTKVHYLITEEQAMKIGQQSMDAEFYLDGNLVKMKNIADILTIDKYREAHGTKYLDMMGVIARKGQAEMFEQKILEDKKIDVSTYSINGLKQVIVGLKRYIDSTEENPIVNIEGKKAWYQGTDAPLKELERLEAKLAAKLAIETI
jgi:hypothetical protein